VKTCSVDMCLKPHEAHGYCEKHYARFKRHGAPVLVTKERDENILFKRFSLLTVVGFESEGGRRVWVCKCDCGSTTRVSPASKLSRGNTKSCGCLRTKRACERGTHHMSKTAEYNTWVAIKKRCYSQTDTGYDNYGGRGITVCSEWRDDFDAFYRDMGPRPEGTSIDRIDNDKGYSKENCRWATREMQNTNKRSNRHITALGETRLLKEWAEHTRINRTTLAYRLSQLRWSPDRAMSTPARTTKR
jgi:hypothetical protein